MLSNQLVYFPSFLFLSTVVEIGEAETESIKMGWGGGFRQNIKWLSIVQFFRVKSPRSPNFKFPISRLKHDIFFSCTSAPNLANALPCYHCFLLLLLLSSSYTYLLSDAPTLITVYSSEGKNLIHDHFAQYFFNILKLSFDSKNKS